MSFKDHFSSHAALYAKYRPEYPRELFEYLATLTPVREWALDCATGSGQAAIGLADFFDCVVGTDGSVAQLQNAQRHARVQYVANLAEWPAFRAGSMDLVAVAQAAHWFDHAKFFAGVRQVLKSTGALALWTYGLTSIDTEIDAVIRRFYSDEIGAYWPPERRYIEEAYRTLPFPLREEATPSMELRLQWSLDDLIGYLSTWSAVQRYIEAVRRDPLPGLRSRLAMLWGDEGSRRTVTWPLHLRVGRI